MPDNAAIRVIGLGGAGNNAIDHMIEAGLEDVDFIAVNTDAQALARSLADPCAVG
jgi:cell division protein FtsZ